MAFALSACPGGAGRGGAHKTRDRHAQVQAAAARGLTITQISRSLRLDRNTVRR
jgi:DNA-binding NarL/FixJ family response regulator